MAFVSGALSMPMQLTLKKISSVQYIEQYNAMLKPNCCAIA